jgi:hypothetical protein
MCNFKSYSTGLSLLMSYLYVVIVTTLSPRRIWFCQHGIYAGTLNYFVAFQPSVVLDCFQ